MKNKSGLAKGGRAAAQKMREREKPGLARFSKEYQAWLNGSRAVEKGLSRRNVRGW